ncbi:MAG: efflux RND transporter permease subunit, partial [Spirochaetaceae bacterium]|nr:efflux RND transporter permease subunit [Spirochaetaceae bacterium]
HSNMAELGGQPVGYDESGNPVYLEDIASVDMGYENPDFRTISNGKRTIALDIMKRPGGDSENLVDSVKALQELIGKETGGNIEFFTILDDAESIGITLKSVGKSAWLGAFLAVMVLLLFLHNLRAALIVSLSIPFTIFLTFILMKARGMSLNIMTLAGITVSIGMIVDASIVILENTLRHRKLGLSPVEAASIGAGEVGGAVLASTSTSLSVFIPILFLSGLTGAILKEVSWILVFSLASSAVTAIIIVPWLSARILSDQQQGGFLARFGKRFDALFDRVSEAYARALRIILNRKTFILLLAAVLVAASLAALGMIGGELFSAPDMNEFEIKVRLPSGYNLEKAEVKMAEIAALVRLEVPEIEADLYYAGLGDSATIIENGNPTEGYGRVRLVRTNSRKRSVFEIIREANRVLPANISDADITVRNGGLAKRLNYATNGAGFRVELSGTDWEDVLKAAGEVQMVMEADPLIKKASYSIRLDREILKLNLNRLNTGRLAVDPGTAGLNLRILYAGVEAGTLKTDGKSYPIFMDSSRAGTTMLPGDLAGISVRNAAGTTVPYTAFSTLERLSSTDSIPHSNRLPSILVVGELVESDLTAVQRRIKPMLENAGFPPGVSWKIVGVTEVMGDSFRSLFTALGIAIFLVYAVMVVQFERFTQPFIIMGAVPFVLIGVSLSLAAFGGRITMMGFFGVIALGGMVVNNAIVLVEFTNQRRSEGLSIRDAVLDAARIRLKPI